MFRRTRTLLVVTSLLAVLAGGGALLVTRLGFGSADEGPVSFESRPGLGVMTSNRPVLSMCVDGAAGITVSSAEVELIREAVVAALDSVSPTYAFLEDQPEPLVSMGCPAPVGLTGDARPRKGRVGEGVEKPSEHSVFVYFVPEDELRRSFGEVSYGNAPEEFYCDERRTCTNVTEGLYVAPSVSGQAVREGLLDVLGLR